MKLAFLVFGCFAVVGQAQAQWTEVDDTIGHPYEHVFGYSDPMSGILVSESEALTVTVNMKANLVTVSDGLTSHSYNLTNSLAGAGFAPDFLSTQQPFSGIGLRTIETYQNDFGPQFGCSIMLCEHDPHSLTRWRLGTSWRGLEGTWPTPLQQWAPGVEADVHAFYDWRDGRCSAFNASFIDSITTAPLVGLCPTVSAAAGFVGSACAAALAAELLAIQARAAAAADCHSTWPGAGNWSGSKLPPGTVSVGQPY